MGPVGPVAGVRGEVVPPVGVGLVGNLLNLVVLSRPNLKGVMYVYLLGLAVSNLCVLLTAIPGLYDISSGLEDGTYTTAFYQAHLKLPMINSFMASSVYIIICMTVNRYISIYKPTQFQRFHTHKNARISILSAFAGGILVHVPLCFQNRVISSCTLIDHLDVVNDVDKNSEGEIYQKKESYDMATPIICWIYRKSHVKKGFKFNHDLLK